MKKCLVFLIGAVCVLLLAGCGSSRNFKKFQIEGAERLTVTSGATGKMVAVTSSEVIRQITDSVNNADFYRGSSSLFHDGWSYRLCWYNAFDKELETIVVLNAREIDYNHFFWTAGYDKIDTDLLDKLLGQ